MKKLPECQQAELNGKSNPPTSLIEAIRSYLLRDDWDHQHSWRGHYYPGDDAFGDSFDSGHLRLHNAFFIAILDKYRDTPSDLALSHDRKIYNVTSGHCTERNKSLRKNI